MFEAGDVHYIMGGDLEVVDGKLRMASVGFEPLPK